MQPIDLVLAYCLFFYVLLSKKHGLFLLSDIIFTRHQITMIVKQILASFRLPRLNSNHHVNGHNNNNKLVKEKKHMTEDEALAVVSELLRTHIGVNDTPVLSTNTQGFGRLLIYEDGNKR